MSHLLQGSRVAVFDEAGDDAQVVASYLLASRYDATAFSSWEACRSAAKRRPFEAFLVGWNGEGVEAKSILAAIRSDQAATRCLVFALTDTDRQMRLLAHQLYEVDWSIEKPIPLSILAAQLGVYLTEFRQLRTVRSLRAASRQATRGLAPVAVVE